MLRLFVCLLAGIGWTATALANSNFPATEQPIPSGWTGQVFKPSFDFPSSAPQETLPWADIDFHSASGAEQYMLAVRSYVFEGMNLQTWDVGSNSVRKWYHVPWMHTGTKGREFIHGLTKERSSRAHELGAEQDTCWQNWAVGFYNPAGGTILGEVWGDGSKPPVVKHVQFPVGTVVAKLLFTEASVTEVPLLQGSPEWIANIYTGNASGNDGCLLEDKLNNPFQPRPLRLLQFDVAVRDDRASATGWVFGTFIYDGNDTSADPWQRMKPIGLMWGNDPDFSDQDAQNGKKPGESIILSNFGFSRDFGRGGRMNGPVDNPRSACSSCHMTAQYPSRASLAPVGTEWKDIKCWFRNNPPSVAFGLQPPKCGDLPANVVGLDFSLQLSGSLNAYFAAQHPGTSQASLPNGSPAIVDKALVYPVTREGF